MRARMGGAEAETASGGPARAGPLVLQDPVRLPAAAAGPRKARRRPARLRRHRSGLGGRLAFVFLAFLTVLGGFALAGKPIRLPVWAVAEIEARLNTALGSSVPEGALAIGAVELRVGADWVPELRLDDLRLLKPGGEALLALPELQFSLDPHGLLRGEVRPLHLRVVGAHLEMVRDKDGHFDLSFGASGIAPAIESFAELFAALDMAFATPVATSLTTIDAEALSLRLRDLRTGQTWEVGDGRLTVENRPDEIAAELGLSLARQDAAPALAVLTVVAGKGTATARLSATIEGVAAQDLAAQLTPLAWLAVLDAPISGRLATTITAQGVSALDGRLDLGRGALQPSPNARPVAFDHAGFSLAYDQATGRLRLTDLAVESPSLRVTAAGQSYLLRADGSTINGALAGELPDTFLSQIQFSQVMVDPAGMFERPLRFPAGALDLRLRLNPFVLDIGQLALADEGRRLVASGRIAANAEGWTSAIDLALNEITLDRLLTLWPVSLVPFTRDWLERSVLQGGLRDVKAALRTAPGAEPRLFLGYNFENAKVRFLPTLPPIEAGSGYSSIDGSIYTVVLTQGHVLPPDGGEIDVAGSVFTVPDITEIPAIADMVLNTRSSLKATLSLLDQPPFNFLSKADRPVALGEGQAQARTRLTLPLQRRVAVKDVDYDVQGIVRDFRSDRLVPGKVIAAPALQIAANPDGISIAGAGRIGRVPFDVTFTQGFGLEEKGKARIEGSVTLSQAAAEDFGLGLPKGMVTGEGEGRIAIALAAGAPGALTLTSDLKAIGLSLPELGWRKPAASTGALEAEVSLGAVPKVNRITLDAAGLAASGSVTLGEGGGLKLARFERVRLGDWLDASVDLVGRGKDRPVGIALTAGRVDLRRIPPAGARGSSGNGGGPIDLALEAVTVSGGIDFTRFRGSFTQAGGFNGSFTALVNGEAEVAGTVVPSPFGSAVRIRAENAGATLKAAGVFATARGGRLDLQLVPRAEPGRYDGKLDMRKFRVQKTSILAELLNAVSVIGLLEQLKREGILFNQAEAELLLTPNAVQIKRGSAIGASMGVSLAGVYQSEGGKLAMQGVISPIYLLNGVGEIFGTRGEGLFGFNYHLRGTADKPAVSVNPLSILTPGIFREIFRSPAPVLGPLSAEAQAPEQTSAQTPEQTPEPELEPGPEPDPEPEAEGAGG